MAQAGSQFLTQLELWNTIEAFQFKLRGSSKTYENSIAFCADLARMGGLWPW